ncbi:MAG: DinB family protein [Longimicrobiales bacterium]|nr:DinB family protein [Longimicrobiales bacterium]
MLDEALEAWTYVRHGVIGEAEEIPDDDYAYRPHPESRSVSQLLRHIVESGLMMAGELSDPEGDFTRDDFPGFMERYAGHLPSDPSPAELRGLLRTTLSDGVERIRSSGEVAMLQTIRRFDGQTWTRMAWMGHGIAHEEYHRGQVALYARLLGRVPALTQKIRAADAGG